MEPKTPVDWLRQGQTLETRNTAEALNAAVQCYQQAITLLESVPVDQVRRELAIAWMNLGNARQKQTETTAPADAVRAYDNAIALLGAIDAPEDFALRNSIGAAWMNRGHAWHRQGGAAAITAALESHDRAIEQLKDLPLGENRSFLINLAAAWMNRAHALMALTPPDAAASREAATKTIQLTREKTASDPVIADVALRAHHALCAALSQQLSGNVTAGLISDTGDVVDDALTLVRHWEKQGVQNFRPLAVAIFYFGAQFFHAFQPQFLAEFLLEAVDPSDSKGHLFDSPELEKIAAAALAQAQSDAYNHSMANPSDLRLQQVRKDLEEAGKRVAEIQAKNSQLAQSRTTA